MKATTLIATLGLAITVGGCGSRKQAPPNIPAQNPGPAASVNLEPHQEQAVAAAEKETGGGQGLHIDDEILKLCPDIRPPHFAYDSSRVNDDYRAALMSVAKCMKSGGLQGKAVLLVGHADPRGEDDYNLSLGGRRAESVRGALETLGVERARLDVSSRGEADATGSEESGWSKDRRVDLKLKVN